MPGRHGLGNDRLCRVCSASPTVPAARGEALVDMQALTAASTIIVGRLQVKPQNSGPRAG